jgi:hypothetical protein
MWKEIMMDCFKSFLCRETEENRGNQDTQQQSEFELDASKVKRVHFTSKLALGLLGLYRSSLCDVLFR